LNDFLKRKQETKAEASGEGLVPIFKQDSSDDANEIVLGGSRKGLTPPKSEDLVEEEKKEVEETAPEAPEKDWFSILDKEESKKSPIEISDLKNLYRVRKDRSDKKSVLASVSITLTYFYSFIAALTRVTWLSRKDISFH